MGQHLLVLPERLVVAEALGAAHASGVEPVVRTHRDGHEAEGAESPRRGEEHQHPAVTQPHAGRPSLLAPKGFTQLSLLTTLPLRVLWSRRRKDRPLFLSSSQTLRFGVG